MDIGLDEKQKSLALGFFYFYFTGLASVSSVSLEINEALHLHTPLSAVLVADRTYLREALHPRFEAAYLRNADMYSTYNPSVYSIELTKPARIVSLWFTVRLFGLNRIREYLTN